MPETANFTATWVVNVLMEEGSVPDRPMSHSSTGADYRPARAELKFRTDASSNDDTGMLKLSALTLADGTPLSEARAAIKLVTATVYGPRLKKNGKPGGFIASEEFYPYSIRQDRAPAWLSELIASTLVLLT